MLIFIRSTMFLFLIRLLLHSAIVNYLSHIVAIFVSHLMAALLLLSGFRVEDRDFAGIELTSLSASPALSRQSRLY